MSSEDDSCTSAGSGSASTMDLLHDSSPASLPHSQPSVLSSQTHPSLHHHQSSAFHHQLSNSALKVSSNAASSYKVKRTRQRVDAGEPRNSYASITNFSSQRFSASNNSFHGNHQTSPTSVASAYHQYNGITSLVAPQVNNKLVHHIHGDHSSSGKTSNNNSSGDSNNNTGNFKSNYSLANAASAVSATNSADRDMILFDESMMQWCASTAPAGQVNAYVNGNGNNNASNGINLESQAKNNNVGGDHSASRASPAKDVKDKTRESQSPRGNESSSAHLLRDILQTGRNVSQHCKSASMNEQREPSSRSPNDAKVGGNVSHCSDASDVEEEDLNEEDTSRECSEQETANMNDDKQTSDKLGVTGECASSGSRCSSPLQASGVKQCNNNSHSTSNGNKQQQHVNSSNGNSNISEVKRARVENIVSNMLLGNSSSGAIMANGSPDNASKADSLPVNGCKKRKLYQPQQSKLNSEEDDEFEEEELPRINEDEEGNEDDFVDEIDLSTKKSKLDEKSEDKDSLRQQLQTLQSQLFAMKHQYVQLFEQQQQQHRLQQLATRSMATPFQSPVNLTTSVSPLREEEDLDENLSDKAQTPISQLSDRETPANNTSSMSLSNAIQDPAQFLDEARRILSEQERIGKRNASSNQPVPTVGLSDIECLSEALKAEIQSNIFPSILQVIDATVSRYFHRRGDNSSKRGSSADTSGKDLTILSQMLESKSPRTAGKVSDRSANMASQKSVNGASRVSPFTLPTENAPAPKPSGPSPFAFPPSNFKSPFFLPNLGGSQTPQTGLIPPTLAHHFNTIASAFQTNRENVAANANRDSITVKSNGTHSSAKESHHRESREPVPEQTEAMSLVVAPKRKRHKVTDTRITPRTVSRILGQEPLLSGMIGRDLGAGSPPNQPLFSHHGPNAPPPPLVPVSLPTSVAIPNPSLHQTELFSGTPFAFADPARFGFYAPQLALDSHDDCDDKDNGKNNAAAVSAAAISSVMAAHHLSMLAQANRGSPDSVQGYQTGGGRTGVGSDSGNNDGSEVSFNDSSQYDGTMPMISFSIGSAQHITSKTTLTPMHLRKAKLMFFYVRYPSSAILKMYFPDIKFNKNNTAQLVKWFSNFREFYYIQMEKYARQAIGEGVKSPEEIHVANDSELIRVLNLHYNRNNHIEVPDHFRFVVEQTLREFFKAVAANKDQEQSWKKAIYKIIARLDDNVPEYFKSPNFLEQLE